MERRGEKGREGIRKGVREDRTVGKNTTDVTGKVEERRGEEISEER
jgi:hypothetical protein